MPSVTLPENQRNIFESLLMVHVIITQNKCRTEQEKYFIDITKASLSSLMTLEQWCRSKSIARGAVLIARGLFFVCIFIRNFEA